MQTHESQTYKPHLYPKTILALELMCRKVEEAFVIDARTKDHPLLEQPRRHLTFEEREMFKAALKWSYRMADYLRHVNPGVTESRKMITDPWHRKQRSQRQMEQQRPDETAQDAIIKSYVTLPSNGHQASTASSMQKRASRSMSESRTAGDCTTQLPVTSGAGKLMRKMTRKVGAAAARLTTAIGS